MTVTTYKSPTGPIEMRIKHHPSGIEVFGEGARHGTGRPKLGPIKAYAKLYRDLLERLAAKLG